LLGTYVSREGNTNIPLAHAGPWGTTVNQDTMATLRVSHASTIIQPIPLARSTLCTAPQTSTEEPTAFQTKRTPILSTRTRETRIHSSASVNENSDDAALDRSRILAKATNNHVPAKPRKSVGILPSPTILLPTTVVRIWRIDRMICAGSMQRKQHTQPDIAPHGP
jgi:hypothetical protein